MMKLYIGYLQEMEKIAAKKPMTKEKPADKKTGNKLKQMMGKSKKKSEDCDRDSDYM